ncbi:MAG: RNA-guided pseudouridylation complex pseudouridine synthase subunit Cbf5 [Thermoplasmata archaeon]
MPSEPLPADVAHRLADGAFLLIDKPRGPSSHQVTAWVRDALGVEKAGHAGTLDPNVSGLLWIGIGPALKLLPLVLEFPKRYVGLMTLHGPMSRSDIDRVVAEFQGPVFQTPPVRSAVKRERRVRRLHRFEVLEVDGTRILFDVVADSGTYIRTLAVDVGDALGVGGHLEELRRVGTGPFTETDAVSLRQLTDALDGARSGSPEALGKILHPMQEVWGEFPPVVLKDSAVAAVAHGADVARGGIADLPRPFAAHAAVVLLDRHGALIALGTALTDSREIPGTLHGWVVDSTRVFVDPSRYPRSWARSALARPTVGKDPAPD